MQVNAMQGIAPALRLIGKAHIVELKADLTRTHLDRTQGGIVGIEQLKKRVDNRRCVHPRMKLRTKAAHGGKEPARQKRDNQRRRHVQIAACRHTRDNADAHGHAAVAKEVHQDDVAQLNLEQTHRRCRNIGSLLIQRLVLAGVGAKDAQSHKTAHGIQEGRAQILMPVPVLAHKALGAAHEHDDGQRHEQNADEHRRSGRKAQARDDRKQRQQRGEGIEKLREVTRQVQLELLRTVAHQRCSARIVYHALTCNAQAGSLPKNTGAHLSLQA